ncbi:glutaredoxin 3 [Phreatobacter sp. AB_2022a]|uniref:glutaredoxin 3 n=1 Tax=Phreatobacter sp. AB_2022a TaxID=3003134 RepID=UPI00056EEDE6|nr:glutaredoxin 3 [Phreatobacter sp. AB_2022a]MCZ0735050.1 glutaredoxin 3 [Phreatobacter sp. AB_2022a]CEJ10722.1 Glutaredoxin-3 [bacterium YEK0313]
MPEIVIYTKDFCPYCHAAKALLARKGASFTEIDILQHPERRAEMIARSGGRTTVPQIFIGSRHIGGSDDIHALDEAGELDSLLAA